MQMAAAWGVGAPATHKRRAAAYPALVRRSPPPGDSKNRIDEIDEIDEIDAQCASRVTISKLKANRESPLRTVNF